MRTWLCGAWLAALAGACNGQFRFDAVDSGAEASAATRCTSDASCPLSSLHCDVASGDCFECTSDAQCTQPGAPRCDQALHVCVQCGTDGDCSAGNRCVTRVCVPTCSEDGGDCPNDNEQCVASTGLCAQCASQGACAEQGSSGICDVPSGRCVACTSDAACPASQPRCAPQGTCVRCLVSADCPSDAPVCDPSDHACVNPDG